MIFFPDDVSLPHMQISCGDDSQKSSACAALAAMALA
jgi:hypothetical protein